MEYAIIAAGQGSRLAAEGIETSKPLLRLNGTAMLDRLISIFLANRAESISIIINEEMTDVHEHVKQLKLPVPLHVLIKSTPDSLHSFHELASLIPNRTKLCLTTIDPIFSPLEFSAYIRAFEADNEHDALMAVTDYIDDEKPLYVKTDDDLKGLVYSLTPKTHDEPGIVWYEKPVVMAVIIGAISIILTIIFW